MALTLESPTPRNATYTCGDAIRATVHARPNPGDTLSLISAVVNFKGKVRTLITHGRATIKASTYLFWQTTKVLSHAPITINAHQTWDVAFEFPTTVLPHRSQPRDFEPNPAFADKPGHDLPPTWSAHKYAGNDQSIEYYLELVVMRMGTLIDHEDKCRLPLRFMPPLTSPDVPLALVRSNCRAILDCASPRLDPSHEQPHGLRAKTKALWSREPDPTARFAIVAQAPIVCYMGDCLPVQLFLKYQEDHSTAPVQPEIKLQSFHVRITVQEQLRVPQSTMFGPKDLTRSFENKVDIKRKAMFPSTPVFDGMTLDEYGPLRITADPTFATFSVRKTYMLKVSAVFECAEKQFELVLWRHSLLVKPPRSIYRPIPGGQHAGQTLQDEETLPPYVPGPARRGILPPEYEASQTENSNGAS